MIAPHLDQAADAYRFEWGEEGLRALAPAASVVIIVDVLSFGTAVDVVVGRGAMVLPYPAHDADVEAFTARHGAMLAGRGRQASTARPYTLSPSTLTDVPAGTRLVLPSPNGSALACRAAELGVATVLAGCLRNASAVAARARQAARGGGIGIIAAGERWPPAARGRRPGALRPAVEDLLGAGAILASLDPAAALSPPRCSAEAAAARAAFLAARPRLHDVLAASGSGRELVERGWAADVALAAAWNASTAVAELVDGAFTSHSSAPDG